VGSIAVNFVLSRSLARNNSRALLALGIGLNLALLGAYKYADFFIGTVNTLASSSRHRKREVPGRFPSLSL
jgi:alginate O-acetyltransferase complex protein AlgI